MVKRPLQYELVNIHSSSWKVGLSLKHHLSPLFLVWGKQRKFLTHATSLLPHVVRGTPSIIKRTSPALFLSYLVRHAMPKQQQQYQSFQTMQNLYCSTQPEVRCINTPAQFARCHNHTGPRKTGLFSKSCECATFYPCKQDDAVDITLFIHQILYNKLLFYIKRQNKWVGSPVTKLMCVFEIHKTFAYISRDMLHQTSYKDK